MIHETVTEYNRCGEYVRIFPCKGSKAYEKYFSGAYGTRMLNRIVHKVLFSSEIIPYDKKYGGIQSPLDGNIPKPKTDPKNYKYDIDDVPQQQSYDHYKNKALQKQITQKKEEDHQKEEAKIRSNSSNKNIGKSRSKSPYLKKEVDKEQPSQ